MENIDYDYFKDKLKNKTKLIYSNYIKEYGKNELCGFALYSDNSALSISITINTYNYLKENIEENAGYDSYFRFTPGEWKYELFQEESMEELNLLLQKYNDEIPSKQRLKHRNKIYKIAVDVLSELKQEGIFDILKKDFVLMFGVSEFSDPKMEISYVKKLNSPEIAEEFEQWLIKEMNGNDD